MAGSLQGLVGAHGHCRPKIHPKYKIDISAYVVKRVGMMKTQNQIRIPKSYDAVVTAAGKSLGFRAKIDDLQANEIFKRHPEIHHIEARHGYYVRADFYAELRKDVRIVQEESRDGRQSRGWYVADTTGRLYLTKAGQWTWGASGAENWWPTRESATAALEAAK